MLDISISWYDIWYIYDQYIYMVYHTIYISSKY
eukprot:SAG31_NODE_15425_length_756_cov_0.780822_2_plen_32_part_01